MNLKKTYKFAVITALLLTFFLALSMSVFLFFTNDFNFKLIGFSSLFCFIISFVLVQIRIERYIYRKIEKNGTRSGEAITKVNYKSNYKTKYYLLKN